MIRWWARIKLKRKYGYGHIYGTDSQLSDLIQAILLLPNLTYSEPSDYEGILSTPEGLELEWWKKNKYYAYAGSGIIRLNGTELHSWRSVQPTHQVIAQLAWWEDHHGGEVVSAEKQKLIKLKEIIEASR